VRTERKLRTRIDLKLTLRDVHASGLEIKVGQMTARCGGQSGSKEKYASEKGDQ